MYRFENRNVMWVVLCHPAKAIFDDFSMCRDSNSMLRVPRDSTTTTTTKQQIGFGSAVGCPLPPRPPLTCALNSGTLLAAHSSSEGSSHLHLHLSVSHFGRYWLRPDAAALMANNGFFLCCCRTGGASCVDNDHVGARRFCAAANPECV